MVWRPFCKILLLELIPIWLSRLTWFQTQSSPHPPTFPFCCGLQSHFSFLTQFSWWLESIQSSEAVYEHVFIFLFFTGLYWIHPFEWFPNWGGRGCTLDWWTLPIPLQLHHTAWVHPPPVGRSFGNFLSAVKRSSHVSVFGVYTLTSFIEFIHKIQYKNHSEIWWNKIMWALFLVFSALIMTMLENIIQKPHCMHLLQFIMSCEWHWLAGDCIWCIPLVTPCFNSR